MWTRVGWWQVSLQNLAQTQTFRSFIGQRLELVGPDWFDHELERICTALRALCTASASMLQCGVVLKQGRKGLSRSLKKRFMLLDSRQRALAYYELTKPVVTCDLTPLLHSAVVCC